MPKSRSCPIFNPEDFRAYLAKRNGRPVSELSVPGDIVFTYDRRIFRSAISSTAATPLDWYIYQDRMYIGTLGGKEVGVVHALLGAPAAAMNLEELIAYGARRIYEMGMSGAIDESLSPGDVFVLRGAFSDEGTSKHYFKNEKWFASSRSLTKRLRAALRLCGTKFAVGDAWTTDAPYRETAEKVLHYRKLGAQLVNMESSAVFAIASFRKAEAASVQIVSDVVTEHRWNPAFHEEIVNKRRSEVMAAVLQTIGS